MKITVRFYAVYRVLLWIVVVIIGLSLLDELIRHNGYYSVGDTSVFFFAGVLSLIAIHLLIKKVVNIDLGEQSVGPLSAAIINALWVILGLVLCVAIQFALVALFIEPFYLSDAIIFAGTALGIFLFLANGVKWLVSARDRMKKVSSVAANTILPTKNQLNTGITKVKNVLPIKISIQIGRGQENKTSSPDETTRSSPQGERRTKPPSLPSTQKPTEK